MEEHGLKSTSKIWLSYVAGYVDGEGCIRWNNTTPELSIANTFPYTLYKLSSLYGGKVTHYPAVAPKRSYYRWRVFGDTAVSLLQEILPYLWEKRAQADLAIAIKGEEPGHRRDGMIQQLSRFKRIDYE